MHTKFDSVVAYDMEPALKNHNTFSKNLFPFITFFYLRIVPVPLILQTATIALLL